MKVVGMIPARMQSSRLPDKAMVDIMGLPMIVHTCKRTQFARKLDDVYLATDSDIIRTVCEEHDIKVIMTGSHHPTGSDRLAEAAQTIDSDIIINVQGDEALVDPDHIDRIVQALIDNPDVEVSLGFTEYTKKNSASDIKAVLDLRGNVMYCSRTDLPSDTRTPVEIMKKLVFLVAFRTPFLLKYASWEPTPLETIEFNEYLRILEHGYKMMAVHTPGAKISVDTPGDLEYIRGLMETDQLRHRYM